MFQILSEMVLKCKLNKLICKVENQRDIVFLCVGNSRVYFDAFGADVYNYLNWNLNAQQNKCLNGCEKVVSNALLLNEKTTQKIEVNRPNSKFENFEGNNNNKNFYNRCYCVKVDEGTSLNKILNAQKAIRNYFNNPYIIVVDSCVCNEVAFGTILIKNKGIIPKSGVKQELVKNYSNLVVGDASIICCLVKNENGILNKDFKKIKRVGIFGKIGNASKTVSKIKVANAWVERQSAKRVGNLLMQIC